MSNEPMMPSSSPSFFETWVNALTKPREETYAAIAASPKAKSMTAYLWVFLASIISSFLTLIAQGSMIRSRLGAAGVGGQQLGGGVGAIVVTLLCGTPIAAVLATAIFAVFVALVQWIAKMFGGKGNNDQLAYTVAAIAAPYSLVSGVFVLLGAIPYVGFCFRIILALAGIYIIVLEIMAVKAVNQFGWGQAIGSYFIPGLALFLICCCVLVIIGSALGLAFGNVLSTINQSLLH